MISAYVLLFLVGAAWGEVHLNPLLMGSHYARGDTNQNQQKVENTTEISPESSSIESLETLDNLFLPPNNTNTKSVIIPLVTPSPEPAKTAPDTKKTNEKLANILLNLKRIIPVLSSLQGNITDLLQEEGYEHPKNSGIPSPTDASLAKAGNASLNNVTERSSGQGFTRGLMGRMNSNKSYSIPGNRSTTNYPGNSPGNGSSQWIQDLIDSNSGSFDHLVKVIRGAPQNSRLQAFRKLNDHVIAQSTKPGPSDIVKLSCELYDEPSFSPIVQENVFYEETIFPLFFRSQVTFNLEAHTKSEGSNYKRFYFDRRKIAFGIANLGPEMADLVFSRWRFRPVQDGACYFFLQSADNDAQNFVVGVTLKVSARSFRRLENQLDVMTFEDAKGNRRFHWQLTPVRTAALEHPYILLENRETGLAIEWSEKEVVFLSPVTFQLNQLWYG